MTEETIITGEIVDKEMIKANKKATLQEVRFAALVNSGTDPVYAAKRVSTVGQKVDPGSKMARLRQKASSLISQCQDKMLINLSSMAPKGLKKLEELLEAKKEVLDHKTGEILELRDNQVQFQAAKTLATMVQAETKDQGPSLVGMVIQIKND